MTLSKAIFDTTEGAHKPLGKYIFNNVQFGAHDPLVQILRDANYKVINHPTSVNSVLVTLPVEYNDIEFDKYIRPNGEIIEVNLETAIDQLNRYKLLQESWSDQNTSITIYYNTNEIPLIIEWLLEYWDCYVGVSFLPASDPTKTAVDLGYLYLPQEVVSKTEYLNYTRNLKYVDLNKGNSFDEVSVEDCATGICPIK